jgi:hypothetical protein
MIKAVPDSLLKLNLAGRVLMNESMSAPTVKRANERIGQFQSLMGLRETSKLQVYQIFDDSDKQDPGGYEKASVVTAESLSFTL